MSTQRLARTVLDMTLTRTVSRTLLALTTGAGLVVAATACDYIQWNTLQDGLRENTAISSIVLDLSSGDITVIGDGTTTGVDVRRTVRYADNHEPGQTMTISGSTLTLTGCGNLCGVTYEVHVPRGVRVDGDTDSGDAHLRGVSSVDIEVDSGDVTVDEATGAVTIVASSGDVTVTDVDGAVTVRADSGDITATRAKGVVTLEVSSGDISATLPGTANLTATADSGNVTVRVPNNCCRVEASADSGDESITITQNPTSSILLSLSASSGDITVRPA